MDLLLSAIIVGLLYSTFTIGLGISFRVLNYPDLTLEGSGIFGAAISFLFMSMGLNPIISTLAGFFAGFFAGVVTAFLHLYFKVSKLLSGIICAAILYSINIRLLGGKANIRFPAESGNIFNMINNQDNLITLLIVLAFIIIFLYILFKTKYGYIIRGIGDNENFIISLNKNPKLYLFIGLGISNGLIGLGGAILVQYKHAIDINYGLGLLVSSLAAMMLGEVIVHSKSMFHYFLSNILGTILYSAIIGFILFNWSENWSKYVIPSDVRMVTGIVLIIPSIILKYFKKNEVTLFKSHW